MKPRSIGLATITADLEEGTKLHQKLIEVAQGLPHASFSYFSVYSTETDEDVEIVAEGPEDGLHAAISALRELGYTLTETDDAINAIHAAGVIFRKTEQ